VSKTFNPNNYPNLLLNIRLTSSDIYNQIKNYNVPWLPIRIKEVEKKGNGLPVYVKAFYDYIIKYNIVPEATKFYEYYLGFYNNYFSNNKKTIIFMIGVKARCYRTWMSLIRELHFIKYVSQNIPFYYDVIYNFELDAYEGIDMMIIDEEKYYGVNLYVTNTRALENKEDKKTRRDSFDNVINIDHPINIHGDDKKNCGEFKLYNKKSFEKLINKLK